MPAIPGIHTIGVDDSIEALFSTHDTTSRTLYLTTLLVTIGALATAALTSVDLTIRAPASLSTAVDRQTLRSPSDGIVDRMRVSLGSKVTAGDTLVDLAT